MNHTMSLLEFCTYPESLILQPGVEPEIPHASQAPKRCWLPLVSSLTHSEQQGSECSHLVCWHRVIHWSYSMFTEGSSLWCLAWASCPIALVTFQVCWGHGQGSLTHWSIFSFCPWWPLAPLVSEPSQQTLHSSPPSDLTGSFNLWGHVSPTHQLSHWSWESSLACLSCFGPEGTTL